MCAAGLLVPDFGRQVVPDVALAEFVRDLIHVYVSSSAGRREITSERKRKGSAAQRQRNAGEWKGKWTHQQRHVIAHHELHDVRQRRALRKVDEVLERERERDVLVHLNGDAAVGFAVV